MVTYLGSLFQLFWGREEHCKQILLARGHAHSVWTTPGLPQPKAVCPSRVYTAQTTGCSAGALSQVGPDFLALSRSKLLSFSGAPQGHRPRSTVCFVPFPGPSSSGDQVLGECTVPCGPCVLCTFPVLAAWFLGMLQGHSPRYAICLLWGPNLRL